MIRLRVRAGLLLPLLLGCLSGLATAQVGSIRGVVYDRDFGGPLEGVTIAVEGTSLSAVSARQGNYVIEGVEPGVYSIVVSKPGFVRLFRGDVLVEAGRLTDLDLYLLGDFTELDEYVVEETLILGGDAEAQLLELRFESPAVLDAISSDLMSRAGASDAAGALKLVSGATVKDGKSAVIRGLPDRYVSSQLNGVRLPSADEDKRAVELDQFPSTVIDNILVAKTFTPEQQADASGGAVNVLLRDIPEETFFQATSQVSVNSQAAFRSDFLSYDGGGLNFFGIDDGGRDAQLGNIGGNWDGAVGVSTIDSPTDFKWSLGGGGKRELDNGGVLGGLVTVFYERDSSFYDEGIDDAYEIRGAGAELAPQQRQREDDDDFLTALFDITQATQAVQWGGLAAVGYETEDHKLGATFLYSRTAEDTATLAEDTRGKEFFFPDYDPDDTDTPGHEAPRTAPYLRLETLDYRERDTGSLQFRGDHTLGWGDEMSIGDALRFERAKVNWVASTSFATLDQPDKRQFGGVWTPEQDFGSIVLPPQWRPFKPAANFNLGNLQRIYKEIDEDSNQLTADLELPFEQWDRLPGSLRFGVFADRLSRDFRQDTFSNFADANGLFEGGFDTSWSSNWLNEDHAIFEALTDVDFEGQIDLTAGYSMFDLPVSEELTIIGGARWERTEIGVVVDPEEEALWFPLGGAGQTELNPGDADVDIGQTNLLPSLGLIWEPTDALTVRGSFAQTIARQTFKEITPVIQQEFLGAPIFIGNPDLGISDVDNYDLRLDYRPAPGALLSASYFLKDIEDPIEFIQRLELFQFTQPVNYPSGRLQGVELELRQDLVNWADALEGVAVGVNATFINSDVVLPKSEQEGFAAPGIDAPRSSRDMTNAPERLYNLFMTYDVPDTGTQMAAFYTVTGDTLIEGAGQNGITWVPNVYATEFGTLNVSLSQRIGRYLRLQVQGKNLTNPEIETVYRSSYIDGDTLKTRERAGFELSVSLGFEFTL